MMREECVRQAESIRQAVHLAEHVRYFPVAALFSAERLREESLGKG
jgi:hypothetical protein